MLVKKMSLAQALEVLEACANLGLELRDATCAACGDPATHKGLDGFVCQDCFFDAVPAQHPPTIREYASEKLCMLFGLDPGGL